MKKISSFILLSGLALLWLSACSSFSGKAGETEVQQPLTPLTCILVLPAGTSVGNDDTIKYNDARELEKGAALASAIMAKELAGYPKVRVLSSSQVSALVSEVSGGLSGTIAVLSEKLNCDGVLTTTVSRFKQREGGEYSSDSPASAKFSMVLRHGATGAVLWSADFKETQVSFLSNILSFDRAQSRGFKWINVEELLEQGIKERLADCPYLN
ncbi:MAG: hypothetical protein JRC87_01655 [Deltaproteobacteria bacterium]|nr:hypothetical protein [Deltaproteobacteria bacterium]